MYRRRKQQRTLAAEEFGRSLQSNRLMMEADRTQEAAEDVGSRRVRQITSKQSTDDGSRQSMSNAYISWESMLSRMYRRRKQLRTLAAEEFGRSFQSNRLIVEADRTQEAAEDVGSRRVRQITSKQSTDDGSRQSMSNAYIFWESMLSKMYRRRKQQRTLAAEEFGRSFQSNRLMVEADRTQEAAEDVGSRRVRQIISKQSTDSGSRQSMSNAYISWESMLSRMYRCRKQLRTLAAEEFGRSFQSNRLMVEADRVCRMCIFPGNRCYPQCTEAGSS
ncbi:hypothetical protein CDAR_284121 [Caerostris darwini]|uniref:Uncharacterized protein n=1 Tax=Caerostris darwini TaxID=1538125 RepID=A0AAV4PKG9_9ARAC|nr:hypothetical protein CDAR_284121 [Caerostris darwini]